MRLSLRKIKFLIVLLVIVIILLFSFYQDGVKNFFYSRSESNQRGFWERGDSLSDFWEGFFQSKDLKRENEELRNRNQELVSDNVVLEGLKEENKRLREALVLGLQEEYGLALADLISKDGSDFVVINKGIEDGLAVGMPIITERKVLLGKISDVYEDFSRVVLISNPESSFPVEVHGKEITGIVKGEGNLHISLDKIPQGSEIEEGDVIITCSLGGVFPKELLIGEIREVQKSDIKPFQKIGIFPFFDIEELKTVFVITSF